MSFADKLYDTFKGAVKILLLSRVNARVKPSAESSTVVVMGNGPSLSQTIERHRAVLMRYPSVAVNFAALSPEFFSLRPRYYVLADPHFFGDGIGNENLEKLRRNIEKVDWPLTLFVPAKYGRAARRFYGSADISTFNAVGVEGFELFCHASYALGLAMPRPRNVLIPALMLAVAAGYKNIIVTGADHSWMSTLSVNDDNEVVSVQPHFYADGEQEQTRVRHEYKNYRLHSIVESFAVAFRSYHQILNYARRRGVRIFNATPGSMIDAFDRLSPDEFDNFEA